MEDANLAGTPTRRGGSRARLTLTEALGSENVVHFTFPGERVETADTSSSRRTRRRRDPRRSRARRDLGRLVRPRSRVRMGDEIEVAVDVERIHYFDPETSLAIWT